MSTTDEARAELTAEVNEVIEQWADLLPTPKVAEYIAEQMTERGYRKVEAAPSDTDREALREWRNELFSELENPEHLVPLEMVIDRLDLMLVARTAQPVQVEVTNAMVERGLEISREFPMKRGLDNAYNVMRAVLEAALSGGEHE